MAIITPASTSVNAYAPNGQYYYPGGLMQNQQTQQQQQQTSPIQLANIGSKLIKGTGGITNSINSAGSSYLGLNPGSSFVGPLQPGVATTGSLGSVTGTQALGGIGAAYSAYNMFKSAQAGQKVGAVSGGMQGAMAGAAIAGPWGAVVGGVLGAVAGSLGPSKPKQKVSEFTSWIGGDGSSLDGAEGVKGLQGISRGQNGKMGTEAANSIASTSGDYFQQLKAATGVDFTGNRLRAGINPTGGFVNVTKSGVAELDPYESSTDDVQKFSFDPNNPNSLYGALGSSAEHLAKAKGLSPEEQERVRAFNAQFKTQQSPNQAVARSSGVPMVQGRRESNTQSFADFAQKYKQSQNQAV